MPTSESPRAGSTLYGIINLSSPRAAAVLAADGPDDLLAVVVKGAEEHSTLQAVEAAPSLLVALLLLMVRECCTCCTKLLSSAVISLSVGRVSGNGSLRGGHFLYPTPSVYQYRIFFVVILLIFL